MNLRNVAISFLPAVLGANLLLAVTPPSPLVSLGALAIGALVGILVSRWVVLPYLSDGAIPILE